MAPTTDPARISDAFRTAINRSNLPDFFITIASMSSPFASNPEKWLCQSCSSSPLLFISSLPRPNRAPQLSSNSRQPHGQRALGYTGNLLDLGVTQAFEMQN